MSERENFHGDTRRFQRNIHPVHVEFVTLNPNFDINMYLSIREITGNFMSQEITLKSITLISESIKASPVFTLSSPTGTYAASAIMFIEIIKQIGLQVKSLSNFIPTDTKSYEYLLKGSRFTNDDGKPVMDMTFVFINLYKLVEYGVLEPVIKAVVDAEDYFSDMQKTCSIYTS